MERTAKPLIFLGGCNFRKGKYLTNCRASNSQCGGQGFDPPLLHHLVSMTYSQRRRWLFCQLTNTCRLFSGAELDRLDRHPLGILNVRGWSEDFKSITSL